ncbi:MAG: acetylglutamate kinase [Candidatus Omnitrophota bacterium]
MMQEASKKVDILIEALPYIKRFFGKVVVVKYGGSAVEQSEINQSILEDITFMNHVGIHPVVVHGAGPFISQKMRENGLEVKFIDGIRVTDRETLAIATEALTEVNRNIVKQLKDLGNAAKGFVGRNGELITAKKKKTKKDVGFVGKITGFDNKLIYSLLHSKIIPVVAPLGVGDDGELYNLNADTVASEIAVAMNAEKLVLLTNVMGVMADVNNPDSLVSSIKVKDVKSLMERNVISGGMIPKVKACVDAAEAGVNKTHIIDAQIMHALLLEVYTDKGIGTEIIKR